MCCLGLTLCETLVAGLRRRKNYLAISVFKLASVGIRSKTGGPAPMTLEVVVDHVTLYSCGCNIHRTAGLWPSEEKCPDAVFQIFRNLVIACVAHHYLCSISLTIVQDKDLSLFLLLMLLRLTVLYCAVCVCVCARAL